MTRERFLNVKSKKILIDFIATNGESYHMYIPFAEKHGWRTYTRGSLHSFVNRNRREIELARTKMEEKIREDTEYSKRKRVKLLEEEVDELRRKARLEEDPVKYSRVSDQIRKTLQAIAQELGEWNKEEKTEADDSLGSRLIAIMADAKKQLPSPQEDYDTIEGEYIEAEESID